MKNLLRSASVLALAAAAFAAPAQNLVQDPGFESAAGTAGSTTSYIAGQSIDGGLWNVGNPTSGNFGFLEVDKRPGYTIAGTDVYFTAATLSQALATQPGQTYAISFDAFGTQFSSSSTFTVGFGGATTSLVAPTYQLIGPVSPVTHFSFLANATASSTLLSLNTLASNGVAFDNVSVVATPEPSALAALGLGAAAVLRRRRK